MATYYVDYQNGNDSTGTGTIGAPYQTLKKVVEDVVVGGDTILLADDRHDVAVLINIGSISGLAENARLTIDVYDRGGGKTITRPGAGAIMCAELDMGASLSRAYTGTANYITWKNIRFQNTTDSCVVISNTELGWVFYQCEVTDWPSGYGFSARTSLGTRFINCYANNGPNRGFDLGPNNFAYGCIVKNLDASSIGFRIEGAGVTLLNCVVDMSANGGVGINVAVNTADYYRILNTTVIGKTSTGSVQGFVDVSGAIQGVIMNSIFVDFAGTSAVGMSFANTSAALLYDNAFYNNTTNQSGHTTSPLSNAAIVESADPLEDKANSDYRTKHDSNSAQVITLANFMPVQSQEIEQPDGIGALKAVPPPEEEESVGQYRQPQLGDT